TGKLWQWARRGVRLLIGVRGVKKVLSLQERVVYLRGEIQVTICSFACRWNSFRQKFQQAYDLFQQKKSPSVFSFPGVSGNAKKRAEPARLHVLFVTEKWCDCNPALGLTNSAHNFFGSLDATGLATQEHFHYDEYYHLFHRRPETALLARCLKGGIDLMVFTWTVGSRYNLYPSVLKRIRAAGIPVVAIWFDSAQPWCQQIMKKIAPLVDLNVPIDSTSAWQMTGWSGRRFLPLWTPQDPRIFYDPGLPRTIGISFPGSLAGRPDRVRGLAALKKAGLAVFQAGGQREKPVSIQEYAGLLMRSKIVLNFSNPWPYCQVKGRVFETTLCGAMLLESENPETCRWFEPMVDYISFKDESDLVEKARYFLKHEEERMKVAAKGKKKATSL
ncbi:MAG TPA: glycosyltransferase, partial [bacterium]|nr:glycosyltransferase [bacterium]